MLGLYQSEVLSLVFEEAFVFLSCGFCILILCWEEQSFVIYELPPSTKIKHWCCLFIRQLNDNSIGILC